MNSGNIMPMEPRSDPNQGIPNPKIYKAILDIQTELPSVKKEKKTDGYGGDGYMFRGIDQFLNALHPLMVKHRVFVIPRVISSRHEFRIVPRERKADRHDKHVHLLVEYDFMAEDGSRVTIGPMASEGLDTSDKASNKGLSAALKYALIQMFTTPTQDMVDSDATSPGAETTEDKDQNQQANNSGKNNAKKPADAKPASNKKKEFVPPKVTEKTVIAHGLYKNIKIVDAVKDPKFKDEIAVMIAACTKPEHEDWRKIFQSYLEWHEKQPKLSVVTPAKNVEPAPATAQEEQKPQ